MRKNVITPKTKCVFQSLSENSVFKDFYLAGGTALALQFNHR